MLTVKQKVDSGDVGGDWLGPAPHIVSGPPGPNARELIARDERVTSPSHTRFYPLVAARARGSIVEDVDGNRFLDFAAGIAVCATGHCHPRVVEAIHQQSSRLIHLAGTDFYYEPQVQLCEKLTQITPGDFEKVVYLGNSGAEAVEVAIKVARWSTQRKWIIGFYGGFHGRTMGALSLTSSKIRQRERFGPFVPMVAHAPFGDVDFIENVLFARTVPPDEVAAVIVEPIQGEGGYLVPPDDFLPRLRQLCDRHGIVLVADEIQSGIGRTGKWWAVDHWGVVPDVVLSAKGIASGMPISAVIARKDVMAWPEGAQGTTFGGNPVSCAAALATIDLVESQYMANAAALGEFAMGKLQEIASRHSCIDRVRGKGLMIGFDVVENKRTHRADPGLRDRIVQETFRRGVIMLPCGDTGIRVSPPLCINQTQLGIGLDVFEEAVTTVEKLGR